MLLAVIPVLFLYNQKSGSPEIADPVVRNLPGINKTPTPTPFLFRELTVPFLRGREYASVLSPLEKYSDGSGYTSYLTNYLSDGFRVNGLLTVPKGDQPTGGWPAIIFMHGYIPPAQYRTTSNYASYVDYLARNGFAVFKIDLRGHDKSEGEASGAYYSGDYIVDVLSAYSALQSAGFVNPEKIGLWGHSMAGNVVLRTLAAKPDIPAASIWAGAVYSYSDMLNYGIQDGSYRPPEIQTERQRKRQQLRELYGDFNAESPFWQQVAPTNFLNDIKGSIQLNHAVDDSVVNIAYSRDLSQLLEFAGVRYELKEYSSGGHNLTGSAFTQAMQNTIEFFRKNL